MCSRKTVFEEFEEYGLTVPQIVDRYWKWVSEIKYMIFNRLNLQTFKSDVFAIKCSKRGNDVYRHRVYRRFKKLASVVEKK